MGRSWTPGGRAYVERRLGKWHRPLLADPLLFFTSTSSQLSLGEVWRHFLPRNSLWSSLQWSPPSGWLAVLFPPSHQPLGHGRNSCPPFSSSTSGSPPPASPRRGQPSQPKIATANKEMSSLGLLSSAGAHFFQLGFKLRSTSVCLVSARCQHFCSACSGATGRLMSSVGKTSRNNSISSFFPLHLESGNIFSSHSLGGFRAKGSEWR